MRKAYLKPFYSAGHSAERINSAFSTFLILALGATPAFIQGCGTNHGFDNAPVVQLLQGPAPACTRSGEEIQFLSLPLTISNNKKTNVVFVIDTSGSMLDEIDAVRANTEGFVNTIVGTFPQNTTRFMVMGTRFSSGGKIVSVLPENYSQNATTNHVYWHYKEIDSWRKLERLMGAYQMSGSTYALPNFDPTGQCSDDGTLFNCGATNHIVIVTDDNERMNGFANNNQDGIRDHFMTNYKEHLSVNGNDFRIHAIHGKANRPGCSISNYGKIYEDLAQETNGLSMDICTADWSTLFDALKDNITASARAVDFGTCAAPKREVSEVRIRWGNHQEVALNPGEYIVQAGAHEEGKRPSIYVSLETLEAKGVPTDGTPLVLVVLSNWTVE